ncbi:MAG TPA: CDP-alcohol phosphatidyltransferase family protein [Polyangiaceae bacterium]|nr:CDP-alcohol phosphatidyltransferase family protein [Polyangiaceae bacterium]
MSAREVYQKTRKVPDLFWNARVCRPIAAALVDALKDTRVTPNQITLLAVLVALLAAGILLAAPGYFGLLAGIVVFQLSYVLDCADGMLARYRGIASATGHLLDFLMDEIKAFVILAAVAVRLYLAQQDARYLLLGLLGLVALASGVALTSFLRRPEVAGPAPVIAAAPVRRSGAARAITLVESVAKFLIHYPSYILYAALLGRIELYFFPYVAVNVLYAMRAFASVSLRFGRSASAEL